MISRRLPTSPTPTPTVRRLLSYTQYTDGPSSSAVAEKPRVAWLRRIRSCRRALTQSAAITLVNSFIVARIDYCNSLLSGCGLQQIDKLQRVMNCAARVIYNCGRQDHVTSLLRDNLHWLRVRERTDLVQAVFDGIQDTFSLGTVLHHRTLRSRRFNSSAVFTTVSCSTDRTLFVPRTRLELGKRAFAVAAPAAWNSLTDDVRSAPTLDKFKQCLKTHFLYSHITHSLVSVELSRTTFPLHL